MKKSTSRVRRWFAGWHGSDQNIILTSGREAQSLVYHSVWVTQRLKAVSSILFQRPRGSNVWSFKFLVHVYVMSAIHLVFSWNLVSLYNHLTGSNDQLDSQSFICMTAVVILVHLYLLSFDIILFWWEILLFCYWLQSMQFVYPP